MRFRHAALAAIFAASAWGQTEIDSGNLRGQVTDPSGGTVAGAKVTLADPSRSVRRIATTDTDGSFRIVQVQPGIYTLEVEAPGFAAANVNGLAIRLGETSVVDVGLRLGTQQTVIDVSGDPPAIDTSRTQQADVIERGSIASLPINRRNFLDFALLTPGVVSSVDIADDTDFRIPSTPHSGLSFAGNNGRDNTFTIDGIENNNNSGGVRPAIPQDAVKEFQINRNGFSAEIGWSAGGAVNIVSRSGSKDFHGSLFGYLRQRDLQARNYFDDGHSRFTRGQEGASLGGPLRRRDTWFIASYERLDRRETAFVPIFRDNTAFENLTPSQQSLADFLSNSGQAELVAAAAAMRQELVTTNFPATIALFNANSGDFPFSERSSQLSMRMDHSFADGHQAFVRLNGTRDINDNAQFGSLIGYSRGRSFSDWNGTVVGGDSWAIGPRTLSQTRIGFGYDSLDVIPNDPNGPGIEIQGFGIFGRDTFLPARSLERHYQLDQTFAWDTGKHLFKAGVSINPVQNVSVSPAFFAGTFSFADDIPLATVLDLATGNPGFDSALGSTLTSLGQPALAATLQQPISALQAFNLGLPTYYQQGFGDPVWRGWTNRYGVFGQDSWRVTPALTLDIGLRYELETKNKNVPTDYHDIAPRFGFAWSPKASKGGLVVRGGFGIFYGKVDAAVSFISDKFSGNEISTVLVPITGLPGVNNPMTGQLLTSIDIYNTLAAEGILGKRPILASDLKQFGVTPGPNLPFALLVGVDPHFENPYSEQASLEIERQWHGFAVSAAYNFTHGVHLLRAIDRNLYLAGRTPDGHPIYGFYKPNILQDNIFESTANSGYNAMILRVGQPVPASFYAGRALYVE